MNKGMQYLPHAGQRDRDKWTNLIERDFIGTKVNPSKEPAKPPTSCSVKPVQKTATEQQPHVGPYFIAGDHSDG